MLSKIQEERGTGVNYNKLGSNGSGLLSPHGDGVSTCGRKDTLCTIVPGIESSYKTLVW